MFSFFLSQGCLNAFSGLHLLFGSISKHFNKKSKNDSSYIYSASLSGFESVSIPYILDFFDIMTFPSLS
jgi:hypothetical protein